MKVLIDIGHPAHVHYFRNLIKILEKNGHEFLIIAKDKSVTHELLEHYDIPYIKRRNYPKSMWGKLLQIPLTDLFVIRHAIFFRPDVVIGFSGTHISHAGWLLGIPSIVFDDTEHAKFAHASYKPFARHIFTPTFFNKEMGIKQIRFDSYMELCALHPSYYQPDKSIKTILNLKEDEEYIILRFVSWSASHDIGQAGFTNEAKIRIIEKYKSRFRIFISAEGELPEYLKKYELKIPAYKLHDVLSYARLYIGEGSTTASECAVLGTPAIYCNSLIVGNCKEEEEKYDLCYRILDTEGILAKVDEILEMNDGKQIFAERRKQLLNDKIDPTAFMAWLVENYPDSIATLTKNPDYQYNFK